MSNTLENLEVYQLAESFSNEFWMIVIKWSYFEKDNIGKQLVRAPDYIGANISEGFGCYHYKENKTFCYYSRGSLLETKSWIIKARTRNLISESEYTEYLNKLGSIHIKLNTYIKYIGNKIEKPD